MANKPQAGKYKILLVEDEKDLVITLRDKLESEDFSVTTAWNGKEGQSIAETGDFHCIVLDVMLPQRDGFQVCRNLREQGINTPVIMLTARSAIEDQIEGVETGAESYILKPFNMSYVHAVITTLLRQRNIIHAKYIRNKDEGIKGIKITTKDQKFLNDINKLILENYADPEFNIDKLVDTSYVGRTVFYHKIKSLTGLSPIDFLRQKRLHIAAQLLLETDYNISEVAILTGFNDVKNFSKRFKEIFHCTPSQYRDDALVGKTID